MLAVKNYNKFQHFKDRRPPWIKLYRDLLDDLEWHDLEPKAAKALVMIWLIASENEGKLPEVKTLAFRLRMSSSEASQLLNSLSHWLIQDDNGLISPCHQVDIPERETEREVETEKEREAEETSRAPRRSARRPPKECGEEVLIELQESPAYAHLDVRMCYFKCVEWCKRNHKVPTERLFVNWLNREPVPMTARASPPKPPAVGKPIPDVQPDDNGMAEYIEQLIELDDWIHLGEAYDAVIKRGGAKAEWEIHFVAWFELHKDDPVPPGKMAELNASIKQLANR